MTESGDWKAWWDRHPDPGPGVSGATLGFPVPAQAAVSGSGMATSALKPGPCLGPPWAEWMGRGKNEKLRAWVSFSFFIVL